MEGRNNDVINPLHTSYTILYLFTHILPPQGLRVGIEFPQDREKILTYRETVNE